jgi:hypothetical protein
MIRPSTHGWWGILVYLGIVVGCSGVALRPTPSREGTSLAANSPVVALVTPSTPNTGSAWRYTLLHSQRQLTVVRDGQVGMPVEATGVWLLLKIQVENVSGKALVVQAADFRIVASNGQAILPDSVASALYSLRNRWAQFGGEFPPGMSSPVGAVFDVPAQMPLELCPTASRSCIALDP